MKCRIVVLIVCGCFASKNAPLPFLDFNEMWMWHDFVRSKPKLVGALITLGSLYVLLSLGLLIV